MENFQQNQGSSRTTKQVDNSYGHFLVKLAGLLTLRIVLDLATYFAFPRATRDELQRAEYPGQLLVNNMQERGLISLNDISPLDKALRELNLDGVRNDVLFIFNKHTSQNAGIIGKLKILQNGLRAVCKRLYKAIQPIPYIREKLYCVDDVFVETGIQLENRPERTAQSKFTESAATRTGNIQLKSYYDIFDRNVVSSNRVIVEGEPGYGKSTLTLQAAYDWCKAKSSSPLAGFEVFILLQFRLLRGIKSIYKAIKQIALPGDCMLTENDIKEILASCARVLIVLDGFDEYPDMTSDVDSDMIKIINGTMFAEQMTVVCTRTGCLPRHIYSEAVFVRLTGFGDVARDRYIRLVVEGATDEVTNEIKKDLDENPVMSDLCQVPLFFVMFAHMSSDSKDILNCDSVTKFFTYMIRCFYNHMWKKSNDIQPLGRSTLETADKSALCQLAFEGLTDENQTLVWEKREFSEKVGEECCKELLTIGILVEEELLNDLTDPLGLDHVPYRHVIRFYHKIFTEWYAAHHLGELAKNFSFFRNWRLGYILQRIDPQDVQFVFRFACGLNPITFISIFKYLREFNDDVATLCIFEAAKNFNEIEGVVKKMTSKKIMLRAFQSRLLQRSRIRLLKIASENQIPISSVELSGCFQSVDLKEECLCLSSGLQLPRLDTLKELGICHIGDLHDRARDILDYSARCVALKTLKFPYRFVLLPQSFDDKNVLGRLRRETCIVEWLTYLGWLTLNLQTGKWEKDNGQEMTDDEYRKQAQICHVNI